MLWTCINLAEEERLTAELEAARVQSSFLFRSLYRARKISAFLVDDEGLLSLSRLKRLLKDMQISSLPFYPQGSNDFLVVEHFMRVLKFFLEKKAHSELLYRFRLPFSSHFEEELVRASLLLESSEKVTVSHLRQAVLSALLTPLRQNVGSCFATAPAIFVQREQKKQFLTDLYDLLTTLTLKRTFGGVLHTVPICTSWGSGALKRVITTVDFFASPSLRAALRTVGVEAFDVPKHAVTVENFLWSVLCAHQRIPAKAAASYRVRRRSGEPQPPHIEKLLDMEAQAQAVFKGYTDHALLKTWEFTLASFSDYKVEFYRWNLYASLGFDPKEEGGLGEALYQRIHEKLEDSNEEVAAQQDEYNRAADETRVAEVLMRTADSANRLRTLKAEITARAGHAQACRDMAEKAHHRATRLSTLFQFFIERFMHYFPSYFQEVYDPDMFEVDASLYDDSPAGFRLVYKHGRSDPSVWTLIFDENSYQKILVKFLIALEPQLVIDAEWEDGEKEIAELITLLVQHVQTKAFLSSALKRSLRRHQGFSEVETASFGQGDKKPWSYTSGGTVHGLIKCYYCIETEVKEEKKRVETPMELLVFLLDLLKSLPPKVTRRFEEGEEKSLLMYSPQHVCLLQPGLPFFKEGWLDRGFSYTWARDRVVYAGEKFYRAITLSSDDQEMLFKTFLQEHLMTDSSHGDTLFSPTSALRHLPSFRADLLEALRPFFRVEGLQEKIDGFLRTAFPLVSSSTMKEVASAVFHRWKEAKQMFLAKELPRTTTYAHFCRLLFSALKGGDKAKKERVHLFLIQALRAQGIAPPEPLLFADTNWAQFYFAFAVNPGTMELDLWRVDRLGLEGFPMLSWKNTFSAEEKHPWGVFTAPDDYRRSSFVDRSWVRA